MHYMRETRGHLIGDFGDLGRRFHVDEDKIGAGSSMKGGSDYRCASSVADERYGGRAPGVVARLMGLDSLPTSSCSDPYSTPFFDTRTLQNVHNHQMMYSGNLLDKLEGLDRNSVEPKPQMIISKPSEKFQTEILPPKSAKPIPATHHKLLSPIKSRGYIPTKNAADIMEAAARIIEPGPQAPMKRKMSLVGSSSKPIKVRDLKERVEATHRTHVLGASTSVPSKVRDLKEKVEAPHKPSRPAEASRRTVESIASISLKGQPLNNSWYGSEDTISLKPSVDSEVSSGTKSKGKSISLAIQAKVNVQRREGLSTGDSINIVGGHKEKREVKSIQLFKSQPNVQRKLHKKSASNTTAVLRQNNQKQNSTVGNDRLTSKPLKSQARKIHSVDPASGRLRTSSKSTRNSRNGSRKLSLGETDNEKEDLFSGLKNHPRKKRSIHGEFSSEKSQGNDNGLMEKDRMPIQSNSVRDRHFSWAEDSRSNGMDIVSFTFTTPLARSRSGSETTSQGKSASLDSDCLNLSSLGYNVIGGNGLSMLLEQQLRELNYGVESSRCESVKHRTAATSELNIDHTVPTFNFTNTIPRLHDQRDQCVLHTNKLSCRYDTDFSPVLKFEHKFQGTGLMDERIGNHMEARKFFDFRHPSPVSVLETSFSTESCNYSDSVDSNSTEGSKLSSSIQAQQVLGLQSSNMLHSVEAELSDSASSVSTGAVARKYHERSDESELEYVNEMLCDVELMFKDLSLGRIQEMTSPRLFDKLESRRVRMKSGNESRLGRKALFDCVSECLEWRCRQYAGGGCKTWMKGAAMVKTKGSLAEEVYKEILEWRDMGDWMVDELVDKDMSSKYGRWLDFEVDAFEVGAEIELQLFTSLVDQVLADMLQ